MEEAVTTTAATTSTITTMTALETGSSRACTLRLTVSVFSPSIRLYLGEQVSAWRESRFAQELTARPVDDGQPQATTSSLLTPRANRWGGM